MFKTKYILQRLCEYVDQYLAKTIKGNSFLLAFGGCVRDRKYELLCGFTVCAASRLY